MDQSVLSRTADYRLDEVASTAAAAPVSSANGAAGERSAVTQQLTAPPAAPNLYGIVEAEGDDATPPLRPQQAHYGLAENEDAETEATVGGSRLQPQETRRPWWKLPSRRSRSNSPPPPTASPPRHFLHERRRRRRKPWARLAASAVVVGLALALFGGGVFLALFYEPEPDCRAPCSGDAPVWSCPCADHFEQHADYFAGVHCAPLLKWAPCQPQSHCPAKSSPITTLQTQPPTGNQCRTGSRTLTASMTPPDALHFCEPQQTHTLCYIFVDKAGPAASSTTINYGCQEPLYRAVGCGVTVAFGECKPSVDPISGRGGVLCCCDGNNCNLDLFTKARKQALADGFQCETEETDIKGGVNGPQIGVGAQVKKPCEDFQGGVCLDVYSKGEQRQRRGCSASDVQYKACIKDMGTRKQHCVKTARVGDYVCCCHAVDGGNTCEPGDAYAFALNPDDSRGVWPTVVTCKANGIGRAKCASGVCFEQLERQPAEPPNDGERVLHGCADELTDRGLPPALLSALRKQTSDGRRPRCLVVDERSVCFCAANFCNDGEAVKAFACSRDGTTVGVRQVVGAAVALVALLILSVFACYCCSRRRK